MVQKDSQTVVPSLEKVQHRFTAWRNAKRKGERIPKELWSSATELAREIGINRVANALHLDYTKLKHRVNGHVASKTNTTLTRAGAASGPHADRPAFVEFAVEAVSRRAESVVEFEGRCGKITIRLAEHNPAEIVALAEALSRAAP
jgi:hypothetical protein